MGIHRPGAKGGSQDLLARLKEAGQRPQTPEQQFEQCVSFVYGTLGTQNTMTKDEVRRSIRGQYGFPA